MTNFNSDPNPRRYRDYKFEKEGENLSSYYVRVFQLDKVQESANYNLSNNPYQQPQYTTSEYDSVIEAFVDAYGWVDCIYRDKNDPDSYRKAYNILKNDKREVYRYPYLNKEESDPEENNEEWEKKLEQAYKKGWEENLDNENPNN
jgi:hypothetical protein